jgi:hypothetical protein
MYGPLDQYSRITWVVFQWKQPDLEALKQVFADAWQKNLEKFVTAYRDTQRKSKPAIRIKHLTSQSLPSCTNVLSA